MLKILILGYDRNDQAFLSHIDTLCALLAQEKCSIGIECPLFGFDVNEQIQRCQLELKKIETIARLAFQDMTDVKTQQASKALEKRAKTLLFEQALLVSIEKYHISPSYGINQHSLSMIKNHLAIYNTSYHIIVIEKEKMMKVKDALKATDSGMTVNHAAIELCFLSSMTHVITEDEKSLLQAEHIQLKTLATNENHGQSIRSIIKHYFEQLNDRGRLLMSTKAAIHQKT